MNIQTTKEKIKYVCPICKRKFSQKEKAINCSKRKPQQHKYKVGDLIWIEDWNEDYKRILSKTIKKLGFKDIKHKTGLLYYYGPSQYDCIEEEHIYKFCRTKEQQAEYLEKIKKLKNELEPKWNCDFKWDSKESKFVLEVSAQEAK